ncbi:MAG: hypothetical protein IKM66_06010 [Clostridia bacterium]|nr:hypothetical protein [Clostridia bacterium]
MLTFLNKIIALLLIPFVMNPASPVLAILKLVYAEKEVISLSENGVGSESDPVYLTAHRGITAVAPENTIPAYEKAVELGFYTAECDILLTKDNEWVLNHNSTTDKMFFEMGNISDYTLEELKGFTYRQGVNFWQEGLEIATLDEYLDVFVDTQTRPQIEIKADGYDMLYTVVNAVEEKGLVEEAIVISFDFKQLEVIHELNPDIELWYLIDEITTDEIAKAQTLSDNVWLSPNFEANDQASIQRALDAGIGVSFWTVNTVEDAKMLYDMGVRYIETDILCN